MYIRPFGFPAPARTICLLQLCTARHGVCVLEQPGSSVLEYYPTWLYFLRCLYEFYGMASVGYLVSVCFIAVKHLIIYICGIIPSQVRRVSWWMSRYGAPSPKRQYAWANSPAILRLDVGWKRMKPTLKTCEQYLNKKGKKCWKGTAKLKSTEILVSIVLYCFVIGLV